MPVILTVEVVSASNLSAGGAAPDPYCSLTLLDLAGREVKNEKHRTTKKSRAANPVWNERLSFGQAYDLSNPAASPSLEIKVFDSKLVGDSPLGRVVLPIEVILGVGQPFESIYPLEAFGRVKNAVGQITLKFSVTGLGTQSTGANPLFEEFTRAHDPSNDEFPDQEPNELHIKLVAARDLQIKDRNLFGGGGSSDPVVKFKCGGVKQKSTIKKKTLEPFWDEEFSIPVEDPMDALEVIVEDDDPVKNDFLGKLIIPLINFSDMRTEKKWLKLLNDDGIDDGEQRGFILLELQWRFNPELVGRKKSTTVGSLLSGLANLGGGTSEEEDDPDAPDPDEAPTRTPEQDAKEAEEKKKAEEALKKELGDITINSGDYQIQVQVIEARELAPKDLNGLSDPVVYVECFGQKLCTSVKERCLSCVWDELLIFNMRNLDKEEVEEAVIKIAVMDADFGMRNDMIGGVSFDASYVYAQKDHELYRKWLALINDEDPENSRVQGYLKASITMIGPGDKLKIHDEDEDIKKEQAAEAGNLAGLVLMPPTVKKETVWLVTSVHRAEYLPIMDGGGLLVGGIDAFYQVEAGGHKPLKTKVRTVKGDRLKLNPIFNEELWVPISMPTMSTKIKYSMWDWDRTGSDIIGTTFFNFTVLKGMNMEKMGPYWVNLYGAPTDGYAPNPIKKIGSLIGTDYKDYYNRHPDSATTFKGRVLISQRLTKELPASRKDSIEQFRRKVKRIKLHQEPPSTSYVLKALIVSGSELPKTVALSEEGRRLQIKISVGQYDLVSDKADNRDGVCEWFQSLENRNIRLPTEPSQIPDLFIYLLKGKEAKPICFKRIPAQQLLDEAFTAPAKWLLLAEDEALEGLGDGEFPGSILIKLGFGLERTYTDLETAWDIPRNILQTRRPFQLRCHCFQARDLPAADSNGLADPYLVINFKGQTKKTTKRRFTTNPLFYETLIFECELPTMDLMPQVNVQVFDWEQFSPIHEYMGCCQFPIKDAFFNINVTDPLPNPVWVPLMKEVPGDTKGELLLLFEVIPKSSPSDKIEKESMIVPETRVGWIEIIALGCRDMKPFNFMPMQSPLLQFEMDTAGRLVSSTTESSKRPTPQDPNFLQKIVLEVPLPVKEIFAPPLKIRAKDLRLGGFLKPNVGNSLIDLKDKIPWSSTYKKPQTDMVKMEDLKKHTGAATLEEEKADGALEHKGELEEKGQSPRRKILTLPSGLPANSKVAAKLAEIEANILDMEEDEWVATLAPQTFDDVIKAKVPKEDTGAGLFGPITQLNKELERAERVKKLREQQKKRKLTFTGGVKKRSATDKVEDDDEPEEEDEPPAYMKARKKLGQTLEETLKTAPFETYPIMRGEAEKSKVVGKFKGLVRVLDVKDAPDLFPIHELLNPKGYKIRLYILRAFKLAAMDMGWMGRPGASDPYLKITLGKDVFDDRHNHIDDVTEADFYRCIEFGTELPGAGQLDICVYDYDDFGGDDLIGKTVIDLEDRWFDKRWQELGMENRVETPGETRWQTKPLEVRSLYNPTSTQPQGFIECWVDILQPAEANAFPPDDVTQPPKVIFEIRMIIWKTKDVVASDTFGGQNMNDLYIKVWPEGVKAQETDTHWRCKKGKGSFNWRMKFDVELGPSAKFFKYPYLRIQMWDKDLLKWNDCIAEGTLSIGRYVKKAYKKNIIYKPFETVPEKANDVDPMDLDPAELVIPEEEPLLSDEEKARKKEEDLKQLKMANARPVRWYQFWRRRAPTVPEGEEGKKEEEKEEPADENEWITKFKEMSGLYNMDPPDSTWLHMTRQNMETGMYDPMGSICFSLEIWPKDQSDKFPVGFGRNAPNHSPFCPHPTGRLKFSWNPFVLGSELCGPALCAQLFCCCICIAFVLLMVFCQPALNVIIFIFSKGLSA